MLKISEFSAPSNGVDKEDSDEVFYDALICTDHNTPHKTCHKVHEETNVHKALFNQLIFAGIAKACDVQTLKSMRLVCSAWHDATLESWRHKSVLRLCDWDTEEDPPFGYLRPSEFLSFLTSRSPTDIFQFDCFPPRNLRLLSWNILEPDTDRLNEERWFWAKLGPFVEYICLENCSYSTNRFFELMCIKLPQLTKIKLLGFARLESDISFHQYEDTRLINSNVRTAECIGSLPFDSWVFLQRFPRLEHLILRDFSRSFLFEDLLKLRQDSSFRSHSLKTIDIIETSQRLQCLKDLRLPLKHLSLRVNRLEVVERDFRGIIQEYGPQLETLKLFRYPIAWPGTSPFKKFPFGVTFANLKILEFWGNVVNSFDFLRETPFLEKLKVDLTCFGKLREIEYWRSRKDKIVPWEWVEPKHLEDGYTLLLEKLKSLEIDFKFNAQSLHVLGQWVPNLTSLKTILDDQSLEVVCKQWSDMKELKLAFGSDVGDERIVASVCKLAYLETFEMEAYCGQSKLTEVAIRDGFMRIHALNNLKICVSDRVSQEFEDKLLDSGSIGTVTLIRNYGEGPHFNNFKCCRRMAFLQRNSQLP